MKCFIQLGKFGDIINICPLLMYEFQLTGQKPVFLTSWKYGEIAARMSYCDPVMWDGDWQDLKGAVRHAKAKYEEVVVTQTYGKDFPIQKRHSSFQLDAWDRAGRLDLWDKIPLVLEVKDQKPASSTPHILIADKSNSSPFQHLTKLEETLKVSFPEHDLVHLSDFKLSNFVDCISLYNQAALLVSTETGHLHLSKASTKPAVALATDKPSRWHGSAYSDRFCFYCRYSEFLSRTDEMVRSIRTVLK